MNVIKVFGFILILFSCSFLSAESILITYFEPFGKFSHNSSEKIAKIISDKYKAMHDIELCKLPVVFDSSRQDLGHNDLGDKNKLIVSDLGTAYSRYLKCKSQRSFDFILSIGMDPRNKFKFEFLARNIMGSDNSQNPGKSKYSTDAAGNTLKGLYLIENNDTYSQRVAEPIIDSYCKVYSNIPISKLKNRNELKYFSNELGNYVCNNLSYKILSEEMRTPFLFVHVPMELDHELDYAQMTMNVVEDSLGTTSISIGNERQYKFCSDIAEQRINNKADEFERFTLSQLSGNSPWPIY